MRIRCSRAGHSSAEHDDLQALAGVCIAVWSVGAPLLFAALLTSAQRDAARAASSGKQGGTPSLVQRAAAPLSREYEPLSYYWEVLELLRRLVLSAFVLAIPAEIAMLRLVVGLVTCFLYLLLLFIVKPFRRLDDLIVAICSNVLLVFTFLTAALVNIFDSIHLDQEGSPQMARRVLGFHSSFEVSLALIVIAFVQIVIVGFVIARKLFNVLRALRLEQQQRDHARARRVIATCRTLSHPAIFVAFDKLRALGSLPKHEDMREAGHLRVLDTFDLLVQFTQDEATVFVSHQWLASITRERVPDGSQSLCPLACLPFID